MQHYPRMVLCPDGATRIVPNRHQHEMHVGYPVNEDGTPKTADQIAATPETPAEPAPVLEINKTPPTLKEVIKAGYSREVAAKIVAREAWKAANGIIPYGPNKEPQPIEGAGALHHLAGTSIAGQSKDYAAAHEAAVSASTAEPVEINLDAPAEDVPVEAPTAAEEEPGIVLAAELLKVPVPDEVDDIAGIFG